MSNKVAKLFGERAPVQRARSASVLPPGIIAAVFGHLWYDDTDDGVRCIRPAVWLSWTCNAWFLEAHGWLAVHVRKNPRFHPTYVRSCASVMLETGYLPDGTFDPRLCLRRAFEDPLRCVWRQEKDGASVLLHAGVEKTYKPLASLVDVHGHADRFALCYDAGNRNIHVMGGKWVVDPRTKRLRDWNILPDTMVVDCSSTRFWNRSIRSVQDMSVYRMHPIRERGTTAAWSSDGPLVPETWYPGYTNIKVFLSRTDAPFLIPA
jgi:hypothetical protein